MTGREGAVSAAPSGLAERLRERGDVLMPEWAMKASSDWYNSGGRQQRDDARLMREAAAVVERFGAAIVRYQWQWDPWPSDDDWADIGFPVRTVEEANNRHPQIPGPFRYCDKTIPVRLIRRTTLDEPVES